MRWWDWGTGREKRKVFFCGVQPKDNKNEKQEDMEKCLKEIMEFQLRNAIVWSISFVRFSWRLGF